MEARDLVQKVSVLSPSDPAMVAVKLLTASALPGIVVRVDDSYTTIPAAQVLRIVLPPYVQDDPALGRIWDEESADQLAERLSGRRVCDLLAILDHRERREPVVDANATVVEIAAVMASAHVPLVAVLDNGNLLGVVTVRDVAGHLLT